MAGLLNNIFHHNDLADKPLPTGAIPCIKSGYCCTVRPCVHGEMNRENTACKNLLPANELGQRLCGIFDWIKANDPTWPTTPAFGAGCSSPFFNDMRKKIVTDYKNGKTKGSI